MSLGVLQCGGGYIRQACFVRRRYKPLLKRINEATALEAAEKRTQPVLLPLIRFHDLRHTCATLLLLQGEHPKVVQERLGHSNISMTLDTYSHVLPTLQKGASEKLDQLLSSVAG